MNRFLPLAILILMTAACSPERTTLAAAGTQPATSAGQVETVANFPNLRRLPGERNREGSLYGCHRSKDRGQYPRDRVQAGDRGQLAKRSSCWTAATWRSRSGVVDRHRHALIQALREISATLQQGRHVGRVRNIAGPVSLELQVERELDAFARAHKLGYSQRPAERDPTASICIRRLRHVGAGDGERFCIPDGVVEAEKSAGHVLGARIPSSVAERHGIRTALPIGTIGATRASGTARTESASWSTAATARPTGSATARGSTTRGRTATSRTAATRSAAARSATHSSGSTRRSPIVLLPHPESAAHAALHDE